MALALAILLTSMQGLSQTIETLKPIPGQSAFDASLEQVAKKLQQGEVCERNLTDTTYALNECAASVGDSHKALHIGGGVVVGAVLTFIVCSFAKCGGN